MTDTFVNCTSVEALRGKCDASRTEDLPLDKGDCQLNYTVSEADTAKHRFRLVKCTLYTGVCFVFSANM